MEGVLEWAEICYYKKNYKSLGLGESVRNSLFLWLELFLYLISRYNSVFPFHLGLTKEYEHRIHLTDET